MSVLIKGMNMPTNCDNCWALDDYGDYPRCRITEEQRGYNFPIREKRMGNCPLVEIPPHGRLIDADALYKTIDATSERTIGHTTFKETVLLDIRGMPTILESTMGQVNSEKAINEAEEGE